MDQRAKLVAQAARQNQHAQVLPVNTLEWITMAATFCNIDIGRAAKENRNSIIQALEGMLSCYNELPDVAAYTTDPPAKRARKSKGGTAKPEEPDEGHDKGLKIGARRQIAMKNFLTSGTFSGLQLLRQHLTWVGDYKYCVVTDDLMMKKWFWVGSVAKSDEAEQTKADATQLPASCVVPRGASHAPLSHDSALSAEQFDLMLSKAIAIFESDTAHLDRDERKAKFKPTEEQWLTYRRVIQAWTETIAQVAVKDLQPTEMELLENTVLRSSRMDAEICSMLARRPRTFHLNMLPTLQTEANGR